MSRDDLGVGEVGDPNLPYNNLLEYLNHINPEP